MRYQFFRQPSFPLQVILICGIGALLGLLSVWSSPYFLIIGLGAIIYLIVIWRWPEFALLGLLLLLATIFDENLLPSIPIGIGHFIVSDFLLFIPIAILLLRVWSDRSISFNHTPLDFPLLAFYVVAIFSTILAIVNRTETFNQSLGEWRVVNLWLTFFLVTNLINDEKHLRRLLNGIFVLSILVALMMIAQYFIGDITQILPGRVEVLYTANISDPGVTRIIPPGQSLVLLALIVFPVLMILDKSPSKPKFIFRFLLMLIVGLAVIITFNRNFWVAVVIAMFLVAFLISFSEKIKFINLAIWLAMIVIVGMLLILSIAGDQTQAFVSGVATRFDTLFNPDTLGESSLAYRQVETEYALPQIAAHPLIGLGLGANYRPLDNRIDFGVLAYDKLAYIHNGHVWMILKTGIIGYLFFIWFLFLFLLRSFTLWRQISDPFQRAIVLAFAVAVIGILPAIIVNPIFEQSYWTPLLGIIIGINEVIFRLNRNRAVAELEGSA